MTAAVILAAGAGTRLGTVAKALLATRDGRSFLAAVHDTARAAGVSDLVVVVGPPHQEAVAAEARRLGMAVVENPAPSRGMASSVALGFAHAGRAFAGAPAALLWPVDHPHVRPETVRTLVARARPGAVIIPVHRGRGGHPTAFGRDLWPALSRCASLAEGARSVLRARERAGHARPERVAVEDPGVRADVDLPADLADVGAAPARDEEKPATLLPRRE